MIKEVSNQHAFLLSEILLHLVKLINQLQFFLNKMDLFLKNFMDMRSNLSLPFLIKKKI